MEETVRITGDHRLKNYEDMSDKELIAVIVSNAKRVIDSYSEEKDVHLKILEEAVEETRVLRPILQERGLMR